MSRLPAPGADDGVWGNVLNDFLGVSHAGDGTLKSGVISAGQLQDNSITNTKLDSTVQTSISSKYTKPSSGIPKTDLDSTTQASLTKADGSLQASNNLSDVTAATARTNLGLGTAATMTPATLAANVAFSGTYSLGAGRISVGCEPFSRLTANGIASTTSGILRLTYWTAYQTFTAGSVRIGCSTTAAGATPTLCRIGIYSVAGNGDLNLIVATANDTTLFASTLTRYTKALSGTATITAGNRYATGVLVVTAATAPTIIGQVSSSAFGAEMAESPRMAGSLSAQSDLPNSVPAADVSNHYQMMYVAVST
jgi:hypothetical protein